MDLNKLQELIDLVKKNNLSEIEYKEKGFEVRLVQASHQQHQGFSPFVMPYGQQNFNPLAAATVQMSQQSPQMSADSASAKAENSSPKSNLKEIRSPFVGTFYSSPGPDTDSFVSIGQKIQKGKTLCIVEAMKLMNEIESDTTGVIREILIKNEEPVEYNQLLFLVEPS